ncbi:MAG TPA: hypothetical protein VEJ63_06595 [Planctomycetota bacterium]|nr:hypothetical protein [Planctomycetota bacterium]
MNPNQTPHWQLLTGLSPEAEEKMSPEARDAAIRKLLADVERRAQLELDRADKCPDGERTPYWDPVQAACQDLGISRVKLSKYARRLTGVRAQEIGDKLKAKLVKPKIEAWIAEQFKIWWEVLGKRMVGQTFLSAQEQERSSPPLPFDSYDLARKLGREFSESLKFKNRRDAANRFAIKVGFANITRLRKAVVLAFGTTLESIMTKFAYDIVQKCVEQNGSRKDAKTQRTETKTEQPLSPVQTPFGEIPADSFLLKERKFFDGSNLPQTDEEWEAA